MNATGVYWWRLNNGSGNGLVLSGNKPLAEPMLTQIYAAIWRQQAMMSWERILPYLLWIVRQYNSIYVLVPWPTEFVFSQALVYWFKPTLLCLVIYWQMYQPILIKFWAISIRRRVLSSGVSGFPINKVNASSGGDEWIHLVYGSYWNAHAQCRKRRSCHLYFWSASFSRHIWIITVMS